MGRKKKEDGTVEDSVEMQESSEMVSTLGYSVKVVLEKDASGTDVRRVRHQILVGKAPVDQDTVAFETGDAAEAMQEIQRKLGQMISEQRRKLD